VHAVLYSQPMSWSTVTSAVIPAIGLVVAVIAAIYARSSAKQAGRSVVQARRSADAAEQSVSEAKRAADAAERSAGAATITAEADRAQEHRARQPRLRVVVDQLAAHDGPSVIYRVHNDGPANLESVVVNQPVPSEADGRIHHEVAPIGGSWSSEAEIGPIGMGAHARFTLSLGHAPNLPAFAVRIDCRAGVEDWSEVIHLDEPREPRPNQVWLPTRR